MKAIKNFWYWLDDFWKGLIFTILIIAAILFLFFSFVDSDNLDWVKERAKARWEELGFDVVGYDGYNWGTNYGVYGGAEVWYVLKKHPDNGLLYSGYLQRWGDELHMYKLSPVDATRLKSVGIDDKQ